VSRLGTLDRHPDFPSRFVEPRHVDVWLPPGYNPAGDARYPVVYMHDGQNLFEPPRSLSGADWGIDKALVRLVEAGQTRGAIVVGVWCTEQRVLEYMPQKALASPEAGQRFAQMCGGEPGSDDYLRFLVHEVKPFVDAHYRTLPEREHTSVMGSSMGGLISLYALCEVPDVFAGAGCLSTHWPIGDGAVIDYLRRALPPPDAHRFYFDYGTETLDAEYEAYQQQADEVLRAAGYREGVDWLTLKFPGAEHSERAWRERVHIPLLFLLEGRAL
jgi:predicted alpha/beta superfamily hydrolase